MRATRRSIPVGLAASAVLLAAGGALSVGEPAAREHALETSRDHAERARTLQRRSIQDPRDGALRIEAAAALRDAVRAGSLSPFEVVLPGVLEDLYGAPEPVDARAGLTDAQFQLHMERVRANNPHPWAADIAFGEDFEYAGYTRHVSLSALSDLRPIAGQAAANGNVWKTQSTRTYTGLLTNETAQTGVTADGMGGFNAPGSGYKGVAGGPDPTGEHGAFLASPRGSVQGLTTLAFDTSFQWVARLDHAYFLPTPEEPIIAVVDVYMDSLETLTWWRPAEYGIVSNIIMGGLDFFTFAQFTNADHVIDKPIVLGLKPGSINEGEYFGTKHTIKAREWFQVGMRLGLDSFSVWIRDSETQGDNPSGSPYDAPGYSGEIFDTEWVQVFPGFHDDPGTNVIEGAGVATQWLDLEASKYFDAQGNSGSLPYYALGLRQFNLMGGFDYPPAFAPGYEPTDVYWDNYSVIGREYVWPAPSPPAALPFEDDLESHPPGPLGYANGWEGWYGYPGITENTNHTPGEGSDGAPASQSAIVTNLYSQLAPNAVLSALKCVFESENDLAARATADTDISLSWWMRLSDTQTSYMVDALSDQDEIARVFVGLRDAYAYVDGRLAVQAVNPSYDPDAPRADTLGSSERWDGVANRRTIPAPLVFAGSGAPAFAPVDAWFKIEMRIGLEPGDTAGTLAVFLNDEPLAIDASFFSDLGHEAPSVANSAPTLITECEVWSGNELYGFGSTMWLDDMRLDGAAPVHATRDAVTNSPFTEQPVFEHPYLDDFASWDPTTSLDGQGATPYLERGQLADRDTDTQVVLLGAAEIAPGDDVLYYVLDEVLLGAEQLPAGIGIGERVAIAADYPATLYSESPPVPGSRFTPSSVWLKDNGEFVGLIRWRLDSDAIEPWDGETPLVGAYDFRYEPRWRAQFGDPRVVEIQGAQRGQSRVLALDAVSGTSSILPRAASRAGERASVSFDLFLECAGNHPTAQTRVEFTDGGSSPRLLAGFTFGGPNIYLDLLNNVTLAPGPDGSVDDFSTTLEQDRRHLYITRRVENRSYGALTDSGFDVPLNAWMRVECSVGVDSDWRLSIRDVGGALLYEDSGLSVDYRGTDPTIGAIEARVDYEYRSSFEREYEPIVFRSLGPDAPPEGGPAPIQPGLYERPQSYFYYRISEIDPILTPDPNALPDVRLVDPATGADLGLSKLAPGSVVAFFNDTGSGAGAPTGTPLADIQPRNGEWRLTSSDGRSIIAGGRWSALPLLTATGYSGSIPPGGIVHDTPPYNDRVPYRALLMGSIVDLPAYPPAVPTTRALVDNLTADLTGCFMDLFADGSVDSGDLGLLIADWGSTNKRYDANADGVINGEDLAALLSNWGVCE